MIATVIGPGRAFRRITRPLQAAGILTEAAPPGSGSDLAAALELGARGRAVVFVPPKARVARTLRRILVLHDGGPAAAPGIEAADQAALASGAEIVVLHVASFQPPPEQGSLPAPRLTDHVAYDWLEWRQEFLRRFCQGSDGVSMRLEVALGPPAETLLEQARELRADLMVLTWKREPGAGRAETVKAVSAGAPCPVLILPEILPEQATQSGPESNLATTAGEPAAGRRKRWRLGRSVR